MTTKLFKRNTTLNGITDTGDSIVYDLSSVAGSSADTAIVNTVVSSTEIQLTKTAGGSTIAFITGRVPAGGVTITQADISSWFKESNMNANCGGRLRVFRYQPGPTITELGGGPFNDGAEFTTSDAEYAWIANFTDQALNENDRILFRIYITNVGTMGGGWTCTMTFNGADGATGDSFINLAETIAFKAESKIISVAQAIETDSGFIHTFAKRYLITQAIETDSGFIHVPARRYVIGQSIETDIGFILSAIRRYSIGQATEIDFAFGLVGELIVQVDQAIETNSGFILSAARQYAIGQATENDTSLLLNIIAKVNQAIETDTGFILSIAKQYSIGQATEIDTAILLNIIAKVNQVIETDIGLVLSATRRYSIGQATETDIAILLDIIVKIGQSIEIDTGFILSIAKQYLINQAIENNSAFALDFGTTVNVEQAIENDSGFSINAVRKLFLDQVLELDTAIIINVSKLKEIQQAIEIDTAIGFGTKLIVVEQAIEIDTGLNLIIEEDLVTHLTIFTDLSNKFKVDWNTLTPIEWPNTPKLAGANESYVKFDITFDMTRNAIIGGGKQFYAGIVNIYAFSPINKGTKESYDLAEQAIILLQNKVIGNVFTYAGGIVPIGKDPQNTNLYAVKAKIPFQSIH